MILASTDPKVTTSIRLAAVQIFEDYFNGLLVTKDGLPYKPMNDLRLALLGKINEEVSHHFRVAKIREGE